MCNNYYIITNLTKKSRKEEKSMCDRSDRISWTVRVLPELKHDIAIEAAKNDQSVAETLEQILKNHFNGVRHE